jgi:hypothetical protein
VAKKLGWATLALILVAVAVILRPATEPRHTASKPKYEPLTREELIRRILFDELQPVTLKNCEMRRFGEYRDGGYLACGNLLDKVESAYSYGIGGYDGWGCEVSAELGVTVHRYDCFNTANPECPNGRPMFHAECVGTEPATIEGRPFDSMANQIARNGDAKRRLILKIDVEGAEWDAFLQTPDEVLHWIDQLVVEFHRVNDERYVNAVRKLKQTFHVANLHFNNYSCQGGIEPFTAWAYEVLFVNKRLAEADPSVPAPVPHPLDTPNGPERPDCQPPRR